MLLGAWSLAPQRRGPLVEPAAWDAMVGVLGRHPAAALEGPRLRLLADDLRGTTARVGFAVDGGGALPEGHWAQAQVDGGRLVLARGLSGGERLYFARVGGVLLFASSVRPLLAHPRIGARVDLDVVGDVLLTGLVQLGDATLHAGVREVLAGHAVEVTDHVGPQRWHTPEALEPPIGDPLALAREFRERLTEAVALAAGPERPVPLALSGGIDSSAVAAAAVDAFGADGVIAYTYEFDDPTHSTELDYARLVAGRLGIRRHEAFRLPWRGWLHALPEIVWRSESHVHWPKAFMLVVAREMRRRGHDRYLTGFGVGSHMAWLRDLADVAPRVGGAALQGMWRDARFAWKPWAGLAGRLHPGLEPPHPRLYHLVTRLLHHGGVFRDLERSWPSEMHPLLRRLRPVEELVPGLGGLPLRDRLWQQAFGHLVSCIDVTRSEKASRELGVYRIAPAHFARCLPYAYLPLEAPPSRADRALRPGKLLLRLGWRGVLPDEVLFRVKSWGDAVASNGWLKRGRVAMLAAHPGFPAELEGLGPDILGALRYWEPRSILASGLAFRLWHRMFVDEPALSAPPSWAALGVEVD